MSVSVSVQVEFQRRVRCAFSGKLLECLDDVKLLWRLDQGLEAGQLFEELWHLRRGQDHTPVRVV
ncbi:hypothetical protein [Sphaerisporangium sp. NPDC051011]|uniref:hypothetical protein n=1 Tax=Sphaerisporangium sp. NPDC051011 TaxID=3155792 RepID=UPI0033EBA29A